ncbi:hypothetical protein BDEG_27214 [Batrachochytrium dendrobatidis JEL423]|uniref:RxLR effector protein n=1 Tax=Batrachochytrium dendrobatidis (strain JEL423) TaxID=403673 RepID=A0A177WWQ1_BATDL|nr:hypothetical protein BDEG_27214 [Batrachochytrium dendrobatidis JEL423]
MKLAVAVLSSILLACSVTTANPIDPSATTDAETITSTVIPSETTDVEASTLPTPNPNGIGLDSLDPLSDSIKELLKSYHRKHVGFEEQVKKCELLKSQYKDQQTMVKHAKRKLHVVKHRSLRDGGNRKHGNEIWDNMRDTKIQELKLADLKQSYRLWNSNNIKVRNHHLYPGNPEFPAINGKRFPSL